MVTSRLLNLAPMAYLSAAGLRFDFYDKTSSNLNGCPASRCLGSMQPVRWETRINLYKRQSSACRVWILSRSPEKIPLLCLGSKQAMHRTRIIRDARDRPIYRAACETSATGDLNTLTDFTYDPKASVTTADSIGTIYSECWL